MADLNLAIRLGLADGFSAPAAKASEAAAKLSGSAGALFKRVEASKAILSKISDLHGHVGAYRALAKQSEATGKKLDNATKDVQRLGRAIGALKAPVRDLEGEQRLAKASSAKLAEAHRKDTAEFGKLRKQLGAAGIDTENLEAAPRELGAAGLSPHLHGKPPSKREGRN